MKQLPISSLLKNKEAIYNTLTDPKQWPKYIVHFVLIALLGMAAFGLVMGTYVPHWWHSLNLAWKTIVLIWGPLAICTPSLFVFGAIRGSRITLSQLLFLLSGALATSGIVLLALTPLTWFFTWTTETSIFLRVMNGMFIGLALAFGMFFFSKGLLYIHKQLRTENTSSSISIDVVVLWFILLIIVVAQMSIKLGPWYEMRSIPVEFTDGNNVFPDNPKGSFVKGPEVETTDQGITQIQWDTSLDCFDNYIEMVDAQYTENSTKRWVNNYHAECESNGSDLHCVAKLPEQWKTQGDWKLQAHSNCSVGPLDSDNVIVSDVVTITY